MALGSLDRLTVNPPPLLITLRKNRTVITRDVRCTVKLLRLARPGGKRFQDESGVRVGQRNALYFEHQVAHELSRPLLRRERKRSNNRAAAREREERKKEREKRMKCTVLAEPRYRGASRISGRAVVEPRDRISHGRLILN